MKLALRYIGYIITGILLGGVIGFIIVGSHAWGEELNLGLLNNRDTEPSFGLKIGSTAPSFKLYTIDGDLINLDDVNGSPVVINFWATWCAPCKIEMPILQDRYDTFGTNLIIFAVNAGESKSVVQKFVDDNSISFPTLLDPSELVQKMYLIRAYPTTYFIDNKGVIQAVHVGILSEKQLDTYLGDIGVFDG